MIWANVKPSRGMDLHRISTTFLPKNIKVRSISDTMILILSCLKNLSYILQSLHATFSINHLFHIFVEGSRLPIELIKSCWGYGKQSVIDFYVDVKYSNNSHIFPCSLGVHHALTCFKYRNKTGEGPLVHAHGYQAPKRCKAAARRPCKAASARSPFIDVRKSREKIMEKTPEGSGVRWCLKDLFFSMFDWS